MAPGKHAHNSLTLEHGAQRALEILVDHWCKVANRELYVRHDKTIVVPSVGVFVRLSECDELRCGISDYGSSLHLSFSESYLAERQGAVMKTLAEHIDKIDVDTDEREA